MPAHPDNAATSNPEGVNLKQSPDGHRHLGLVVVLVIALQIVVPTVAFLLPPPQRFGFQMYAARGEIGVEVIDEQGASRPFDSRPLVGQLRPEIDWRRSLPDRVCAFVADAAAVRITQFGDDRIVECD